MTDLYKKKQECRNELKAGFLDHSWEYLRDTAKLADYYGFGMLSNLIGMAALEAHDLRQKAQFDDKLAQFRANAKSSR